LPGPIGAPFISGGADEPTIWPPGLRTMTPIWIGRIAIPFLALTAACGAAFVSGFPRERQPPVETRAATSAAVVAPPAAGVGDEGSDVEIMPVFDIALVGRAGDAVLPVFEAMLEKAVHICDAKFGYIYRWDGDAFHLVATYNVPPRELREALLRDYHAAIGEIIIKYSGTLERYAGDGVM